MRRVTWSVHEPSKKYQDTGYFKRGTQGSFEELMSPRVLELGASGGCCVLGGQEAGGVSAADAESEGGSLTIGFRVSLVLILSKGRSPGRLVLQPVFPSI
jgi:hypothetical protein